MIFSTPQKWKRWFLAFGSILFLVAAILAGHSDVGILAFCGLIFLLMFFIDFTSKH